MKKLFNAGDGITRERSPIFFLPVTLWVIGGFFTSALLVGVLSRALAAVGVRIAGGDQNVSVVVLSSMVYILLLLITLGVPRALKLWSSRISYKRLLGLTRLLQWRDILAAFLGYIVYLALGVAALLVVGLLVPGFNASQTQDLGLTPTLSPSNGVLVFLLLVVAAPVAEEIIFRGYLFGTLRRSIPVWAAILVTSLVFGAIHLQWNVGIDVF